MFILQILPDEIPVKLDDAGFAGVTAFARPFDNQDLAKYFDAFPVDQRNVASIAIVNERLLRLDGLSISGVSAEPVPYDHANALHRRSLPLELLGAVYKGLMERASLSKELEGNSGSLAGSVAATSGADTTAAIAANEPATS